MKFKKLLTGKKACSAGNGYAELTPKKCKIVIRRNDVKIKDCGLVDDGIGCTVETRKEQTKIKYVIKSLVVGNDDIPVNLQAEGYKFRIPATKVDDGYVFLFKNATMVKVGKK